MRNLSAARSLWAATPHPIGRLCRARATPSGCRPRRCKTSSNEAARFNSRCSGTRRRSSSKFHGCDVINAPRTSLARSRYIFGLLVRGPKWTKEETGATKKIQEGHPANINTLAEAGKLVLAGPFEDGWERRGIFIFKGDSLEEAQALTGTDPAVMAGRLKIELHPWSVPKGMLP